MSSSTLFTSNISGTEGRPVCCGVVLLKEMAECLTVCCGVVLCYCGDGRVPDDVLWCCVTVETAECLTVCCGVVLCY